MKTTYVMRDGRLVEKPKAASPLVFEPLPASPAFLEFLRAHQEIDDMIRGLFQPRETSPPVPPLEELEP